jgi:nitrite reductase (NO-forming)
MEEQDKEVAEGMPGNPMLKWLVLGVVVIVVGGGLLYYFVKHKSAATNTQVESMRQITPTVAQAMTAAEQITISGSEFAFTPATVTVKKGQQVEITFKNTGKYPHNLTITDLGVKSNTIKPGEQDVVTFTPDKTGNFAFMCTVPGHADKGMTGVLKVE